MALNNDPNFPPSGLPPYRIDRNWCLGDSLGYINANFLNFDTRIETVSTSLISSFNSLSGIFPLTQQYIATAAISSTQLAAFAVTTAKIANFAVNNSKLADNSVNGRVIENGSITPGKLANFSVDENKIAIDAVTNLKIRDGSVTTSKILDGNITEVKLANNSVSTRTIVNNNVTLAKLSQVVSSGVIGRTNNSVGNLGFIPSTGTEQVLINNNNNEVRFGLVTENMLTSDSVTRNKIKNREITALKLDDNSIGSRALSANCILEQNLANDSVSVRTIANNNITEPKYGPGSVSTRALGDFSVTEIKIQSNSVSTRTIANNNVTLNKLQQISDSSVLGKPIFGAPGNVSAITAVASTVLVSDQGRNISFSRVRTGMIDDLQITEDKIAPGAVTNSKIAPGAITGDKLASGAISSNELQPGSIINALIGNGQITLEKLAAALQQLLLPPGVIMAFGHQIVNPQTWLPCDGSYVSKAAYPRLWEAIGQNWGPADTINFKLPDLRAAFLRGFGTNGSLNEFGGGNLYQFQFPYAGFNRYVTCTDDGDGQVNNRDARGELAFMSVNGTQIGFGNIAGGRNRCYGPFDVPTIAGDTRPLNVAVPYYIKT
jgi:hypothetical protein